jgi:hypothetical protein
MTDRRDTAEMGRAVLAILLPIRQSLEASS